MKITSFFRFSPKSCFGVQPVVLPVVEPEERDYLIRLAGLYDLSVEESKYQDFIDDTAIQICHTQGAILCTNQDLREAADLYGKLSNRNVCYCGDRSVIDAAYLADNDIRVIFVLLSDYTDGFLDEVAPIEEVPCTQVGLILCRNKADSLRQGIRRAAALRFSMLSRPDKPLKYVTLLSNVNGSSACLGNSMVIGQNAPDNELRSALKAGANILAIESHSDGLDASLPSGKVLCTLKERADSREGDEYTPCEISGHCHRLNRSPLEEALKGDDLLSSSGIAAQLLYFRSCSFFPPVTSGKLSKISLGLSVLNDAVFACLVAAIEIIHVRRGTTVFDVEQASNEGNVGAAVEQICMRYQSENVRLRLVCFGDPDTVLPNNSTTPAPAELGSTVRPHHNKDEIVTTNREVLGAFNFCPSVLVSLYAKRSDRRADIMLAESMSSAILELGAFEHPTTLDDVIYRKAEDKLVKDLNLLKVDIPTVWEYFGFQLFDLGKVLCPHCRRPSKGLGTQVINSSSDRVAVICVNCGVSADSPKNFEGKIAIKPDGTISGIDAANDAGRRVFRRVHFHQVPSENYSEIKDPGVVVAEKSISKSTLFTTIQVFALEICGIDFALYSRSILAPVTP